MLNTYIKSKYRFRHWTEESIKDFQTKEKIKMADFARSHTEFYKSLYKNYDVNDFKTLPIIDKKVLMDNFTGANSLGLDKDKVYEFVERIERTRDFDKRYEGLNIGMSSGTSGNRGIEVVPPDEESFLRAIFFSRFPHDFLLGKRLKLAFVLRVTSPAFRLDFLGHSLEYVSLGEPWERILVKLNDIKPNAISAPPSFLYRLAQEYKNGKLDFKPLLLISYAESLYPEVKKYLEDVFEVPHVHEIYKATEAALATSCKNGSLHWNEDLVSVELFDRNGREITYGQPSHKMVITNLYKKGTPIVRYELNDIIEFSDQKCKCGSNFRVVKNILGRADDILIGRSRYPTKPDEFIYPDYIRRAIISSNPEIVNYQVVQNSKDKLIVRIGNDQKVDKSALIQDISAAFDKYDCSPPKIELRNEDPIPHPKSFKLRRIIRDFKID